jgi:hypothetical protein
MQVEVGHGGNARWEKDGYWILAPGSGQQVVFAGFLPRAKPGGSGNGRFVQINKQNIKKYPISNSQIVLSLAYLPMTVETNYARRVFQSNLPQ